MSRVLRGDIRQHFPSIDHAILLAGLRKLVPEGDIMTPMETILAGGRDTLRHEYGMVRRRRDILLRRAALAGCR